MITGRHANHRCQCMYDGVFDGVRLVGIILQRARRNGCSQQLALRSILDQGDDPARYHKQNSVAPVEKVIRYMAEHLQTKP